jgi:hypothetical protein
VTFLQQDPVFSLFCVDGTVTVAVVPLHFLFLPAFFAVTLGSTCVMLGVAPTAIFHKVAAGCDGGTYVMLVDAPPTSNGSNSNGGGKSYGANSNGGRSVTLGNSIFMWFPVSISGEHWTAFEGHQQ